jgi:hypothetical protein
LPNNIDLYSFWDWVTSEQPQLPWWGTGLALLAGFALALNGKVWMHTRLLAVYFHEAGHAVVSLFTGRRLLGIRLHADGSGSTLHEGAAFGIGRLLTAFSGYPAPAIVAWLVLSLSGDGYSRGALAAVAGICLVLIIFQRSWRGWVLTALVLIACLILSSFAGIGPTIVLAILAGYLFAAAPRSIWELHRGRRMAAPGENHSDSESLAGMTGIPAVIWEVAFLVMSVWLVWLSFPSIV